MSEIRVKQHPTLGILVCTDGHIMIPSTYFNKKAHWTKGWKFNTGYLGIRLHGKNYQVHRLVAETFISNKDNKPTVDHINRIKTDNRIENLRWATIQEQNENHSNVDTRVDYGIRSCKNKNEYDKLYHKQKYKDNKEKLIEKSKNYYTTHKEQRIQKSKDYRKSKIEKGYRRIRCTDGKLHWVLPQSTQPN